MERAVERSVIVDLGVKKLSTHQSDITVFSYFCNCKSSEQMVGHQGFLGMKTLIPLQSNFKWNLNACDCECHVSKRDSNINMTTNPYLYGLAVKQ